MRMGFPKQVLAVLGIWRSSCGGGSDDSKDQDCDNENGKVMMLASKVCGTTEKMR